MESLLDAALKTRAPLKDAEDELEFQYLLRRWGKKRTRGRAAVIHAIDLLDALVKVMLRDHFVAKITPKQQTEKTRRETGGYG